MLKRSKDWQPYRWFILLLIGFFITGCGSGGKNGHWLPASTGPVPDTTRPLVISTIPGNGATGVFTNSRISATFNEAMNPATIGNTTFTVVNDTNEGTPVAGNVTYNAAARTAIFTPTTPATLPEGDLFTATITTGARDLAGNALAANFTWTFTTGAGGAALDNTAPTVILTNPADNANSVVINSAVNATFSEAMDPATITFTVRATGPPLGPILAGAFAYLDNIATFTPTANLAANTSYTATIGPGATDLAVPGNALMPGVVPNPWTFTTGTGTGLSPGAINLGSLSSFVAVAGAGLTNSNSGGTTTLNGDVGLSPTGTCLGDGSPCSAVDPVINGTLYANDPAGVAAQAKVDLTAAYDEAASKPPGTTVNDISGMVLPPGVYTSGSTMSIAVGGTVTLDGQGDANAVWIFQVGSSLTVNNSAQVLLINGANAKNVFWAIFASSTLGSNVDFKGTVLAGASNSVGTGSVVTGRLLCRTGAITLLSNTITLP